MPLADNISAVVRAPHGADSIAPILGEIFVA